LDINTFFTFTHGFHEVDVVVAFGHAVKHADSEGVLVSGFLVGGVYGGTDYITVSGGMASSRAVGRYLSANPGSSGDLQHMGKALKELKENYAEVS